jgi:hypothetical protein
VFDFWTLVGKVKKALIFSDHPRIKAVGKSAVFMNEDG